MTQGKLEFNAPRTKVEVRKPHLPRFNCPTTLWIISCCLSSPQVKSDPTWLHSKKTANKGNLCPPGRVSFQSTLRAFQHLLMPKLTGIWSNKLHMHENTRKTKTTLTPLMANQMGDGNPIEMANLIINPEISLQNRLLIYFSNCTTPPFSTPIFTFLKNGS